jgi:hypothetical protein
MNDNPLDKRGLTRAFIAGIVLALSGIGLFVILWLSLSSLDQFPRLIIAVCVPPALIALAIGIFFLLIQPGSKRS